MLLNEVIVFFYANGSSFPLGENKFLVNPVIGSQLRVHSNGTRYYCKFLENLLDYLEGATGVFKPVSSPSQKQ